MKKLIPALCLLLISAAMLGTSTFAWFSMNTTVSATNMTVKATASKNLLISQTSASAGFGATVDLDVEALSLTPASTVGGNSLTPAFYQLDKDHMDGMVPDNAALADSKVIDAVENTNYIKKTVWLKVVGQAGTNLKATITATPGEAKDLNKSLRVMLVDKTGTLTYIYSPIAGAAYITNDPADKAVSGKDGSNNPQYSAITSAATSGTTILLASMTQDQAYEFDIYVWFEGEDVNCKATNAVDLQEIEISISFAIAE